MESKNKKGNVAHIILFIAIFVVIIVLGMVVAFTSVTINWVADEVVPELSTLGSVGSSNLTEIATYTLNPVDNVVQSFTWLSGIAYMFALIGLIGLSVAFKMTGEKYLLGFFWICLFVLVIAGIFISNIYEDFYNENDEVGTRLKEHALLSFLILYNPLIICVIGLISGVIMFTGDRGEGF